MGDLLSIEKRLEGIEKMLTSILRRLEEINNKLKVLGINDEVLSTASRLVIAISIPATKALESARRVITVLKSSIITDPISRAIIESLSSCDELSISEIARRVRAIRGSSSRRIIRERLKYLEEKGIVINIGKNTRPIYMLRLCKE